MKQTTINLLMGIVLGLLIGQVITLLKPDTLQFTCFEGVTYIQGKNKLSPAYVIKDGKTAMVPCGKKKETTTTIGGK